MRFDRPDDRGGRRARRVIALVGPTGVGKTTTVAKLAATFKLAHGFRPGLVTVDTYRIAAVEQLRTYAEIIDLPLAVVNAPGEMRRAIDELGDVDLVLIDTAGRSPRDEVKIRELADFLAAAQPDEVHLVLSAVAAERSLRAAVERFAVVRADRLILTKFDEAVGLGGVLAVLGQADRPVSYITTGQAVPDDIEPADRTRLAAPHPGSRGRHLICPGDFLTIPSNLWGFRAHFQGFQRGGFESETLGASAPSLIAAEPRYRPNLPSDHGIHGAGSLGKRQKNNPIMMNRWLRKSGLATSMRPN